MKHTIILLILGLISNVAISQTSDAISQPDDWTQLRDAETGIEFAAPPNTTRVDTNLSTAYFANVDSVETVQVHIMRDARINSTDTIINNALVQENYDTLRAIAKIMLLASNQELTAIHEVYTDNVRGLEMGLKYAGTETAYHSFFRFYLFEGNFVSFSWTGHESKLKKNTASNNAFFDAIKLK